METPLYAGDGDIRRKDAVLSRQLNAFALLTLVDGYVPLICVSISSNARHARSQEIGLHIPAQGETAPVNSG